MTRRLGALIGAVALSLVVPAQHATAKMPALTVDIRPEQPVAGEVTTFDLRTWARTAEDEPLRPSDQWGPRLWLPIWAHRDGTWPRGGGRLEHATRLRFERVGPARYEARTSLGYAGRWIVALRFEGSPDRELLEFAVDQPPQMGDTSSTPGQPRAVTPVDHLAAFAALGVPALWTRKRAASRPPSDPLADLATAESGTVMDRPVMACIVAVTAVTTLERWWGVDPGRSQRR